MGASIYARIGGESAIDTAVDLFYRRVLQDPRINHFFDDSDMESQATSQKAFLTMVLGGPNSYAGEDMRSVHVSMKLDDTHFDALVEQLSATLAELGVPSDVIGEAAAVAESVRDDVLSRATA